MDLTPDTPSSSPDCEVCPAREQCGLPEYDSKPTHYLISSKDFFKLLHLITDIPVAVIAIQEMVAEEDRAVAFAPFKSIVDSLSDITVRTMELETTLHPDDPDSFEDPDD